MFIEDDTKTYIIFPSGFYLIVNVKFYKPASSAVLYGNPIVKPNHSGHVGLRVTIHGVSGWDNDCC